MSDTPQSYRITPADHRARFMTMFRSHIDAVASRIPVDVFVMGPHVDLEDKRPNLAMHLRHALITKLQGEGFSAPADLAEVIETVRSRFGEGVDLATTEHLFAYTQDLLVFIPNSHGSAAEIGFFAGVDIDPQWDIASRSLVLLDATQQALPGFVARGPAALLKSRGASVCWVDYADLENAWRAVQAAVQNARLRKARIGLVTLKT